MVLSSKGKYGTWVVNSEGSQLVSAGDECQLVVRDCIGLHSQSGSCTSPMISCERHNSALRSTASGLSPGGCGRSGS